MHVRSSGSSIRAAGVEHIFWQKTQFLRGNLSFGKSETSDFCFTSVLLEVLLCWLMMVRFGVGPVLLPLPAAAWPGPGDSPVLGHRKGGCLGSASPALPGVSLKTLDALSPLMHLLKYWVRVFYSGRDEGGLLIGLLFSLCAVPWQ